MQKEDHLSKAMCRPACGWLEKGIACEVPMPCGFHAKARRLKEQELRKQELKKCGKRTRNGEPCGKTLPCEVHDLQAGKRWCASTLDAEPHKRCALQCDAGELFCEKHRDFPDLGRKLATYRQMCVVAGRAVEESLFLKWAYPLAPPNPPTWQPIHDIAKFAKICHERMGGEHVSDEA